MFEKLPFTIQEQIERLQTRGLLITPQDNATHYLSHISYYRLGEYWHSMQSDKVNHIFKENSKFKDVIALYQFDGELKILLFDIIEKIEISLRTKLIYHLSHEFNPWWFQIFDLFIDSKALVKTLSSLEEELERSKEITIKNHFKNHKDDLRFSTRLEIFRTNKFWVVIKIIW
jgi:abortive infection bacteriophage resistance protein